MDIQGVSIRLEDRSSFFFAEERIQESADLFERDLLLLVAHAVVGGAGGGIAGNSIQDADAAGPARVVDLDATLASAFLEFLLTTLFGQALGVLIGALLRHAGLHIVEGALGGGDSGEGGQSKDVLHLIYAG